MRPGGRSLVALCWTSDPCSLSFFAELVPAFRQRCQISTGKRADHGLAGAIRGLAVTTAIVLL
jgi:hypothetical protein